MLTDIYLHGPLGKAFGRKWSLSVATPAEALRLINANKPGVFAWIKDNLTVYSRYRVVCKYEDGRKEYLNKESLPFERKVKSIRFIPLIEGAGETFDFIAGAALIAAAFIPGLQAFAPQLFMAGASLLMSGMAIALSPNVVNNPAIVSYSFNGPVNTTQQGSPVSLIYGQRVLVGSQAISASLNVVQMVYQPFNKFAGFVNLFPGVL